MITHRSGSHHFDYPGSQERQQLVGRGHRALLDHHGDQGPLAPPLVGHGDHGGLDDAGMGHDLVLELHRGDPLTAGLDHVLGAVADLHVAPPSSDPMSPVRSHPSWNRSGRRVPVVGAGDPRPADLELPDRLPVVREDGAVLARRPAPRRRGRSGRSWPATRSPRPEPPWRGGVASEQSGLVSVMPQPCTISTPSSSRNRSMSWRGHGGAAGGDHPQAGHVDRVGLRVAEQVAPDGRHPGRDGRPEPVDDGGQGGGLEELLGHDQVGTGHERRRRGCPRRWRGTSARWTARCPAR